MQRTDTPPSRWASLALVIGGGLMIGLWLIFTNVHGPTSYNLDQPFLGRYMRFWGMLLGGPPNLLVAAALLRLFAWLTQGARRRGRVGLWLAVFGLAVAGVLDLLVGALNAPFFIPLIGVGLLLLAGSGARLPRPAWWVMVVIGVAELAAFAWELVLPLEVFDAIQGYRWYGLLAHVIPGLGWLGLGLTAWPRPAPSASAPAAS